MDYNMVSAEEFGKSLTGLGVNIIVKKPWTNSPILRDRFWIIPKPVRRWFCPYTISRWYISAA